MPLSPVISTVRSLPCSRWICSTTRAHRGARREETRAAAARAIGRRRRPPRPADRSRAAHSAKPWRATVAIIRSAPHDRMADRPRRGEQRVARPVRDRGRAARRRTCRGRRTGRACADARERARRVGIAPGRRRATRTSPSGGSTKTTAPSPAAASSSAAAVSRPSRSGSAAASTIRRTIASSASAGEMTYSPDPTLVSSVARGVGVGEVAFGAELLEDARTPCRGGARRPTARRSRATSRPSARWLSAA